MNMQVTSLYRVNGNGATTAQHFWVLPRGEPDWWPPVLRGFRRESWTLDIQPDAGGNRFGHAVDVEEPTEMPHALTAGAVLDVSWRGTASIIESVREAVRNVYKLAGLEEEAPPNPFDPAAVRTPLE